MILECINNIHPITKQNVPRIEIGKQYYSSGDSKKMYKIIFRDGTSKMYPKEYFKVVE